MPLAILLAIFGIASAFPRETLNYTTQFNDTIQSYRLPDTIVPSRYRLNLVIPESALKGNSTTFYGCVKIDIVVLKCTQEVLLNSMVNVTNATIDDGTRNTVFQYQYQYSTSQTLKLILPGKVLVPDSPYTLNICFNSELTTDNVKGVSRIEYPGGFGGKEYLILTQFQSTYARYAFPCFDEPMYKAKFVLQLTYPQWYRARSNTKEEQVLIRSDTKTSIFKETPIMSTYLLAFSVSSFTCTESKRDWYLLSTCSREKFAPNRNLAMEYGAKIIQAMDKWTGYNYSSSLSKLEQFAFPGITGLAMENWGFVTYHEYMILFDEADTSALLKQSIIEITAHEFAHQWFGNLVTTRWWNSLFLNEGFATYFQHYLFNLIGLEHYEMDKQLVISQQHLALLRDAEYVSPEALESDVEDPNDIEDRFSTVTYSKGASVIRMVENIIGKKSFQKGLQHYLKKNAYKSTRPRDLWRSLSLYTKSESLPSNFTLHEVMREWIIRGGFPLITATLEGKDVRLTQKRFFNEGKTAGRWFVPITFRIASSNKSRTFWLKPNHSVTLRGAGESWVLLNHNSTGYFRVKYDEALYHRLTEALRTDFHQFTELDRAQIIDDSFNLALAGDITYYQLFHLINFIQNDTSYFTWETAIRGFNGIMEKFNEDSELVKHLKAMVLQLIDAPFNLVYISNWQRLDHLTTLKLSMIWNTACDVGHQICIAESKQLFEKFKEYDVSINPDLRQAVYCNTLKYSKEDEDSNWEFLWNRSQTVDQPHENYYILNSLGCTRDKRLLKFYLDASIRSVTPLEFEIIWDSVYMSSSIGLEVAFDFFLQNMNKILEHSYDYAISTLGNIIERLSTRKQIRKLENLTSYVSTYPDMSKFLHDIMDRANHNLKLKMRMRNKLESYFGIQPQIKPSL